jgi:nucleotide-binding universal stress UspA family protein
MLEMKTVLCPVDFSTVLNRELQLATQICHRFNARLVVQHDLERLPPAYLATHWMYSETHLHQEEDREKAAERMLQAVFSKLPPSVKPEGRMTRGPLDVSILYLARELPADLIVMATHGKSTLEHVSVTERVVAQTPCPVLTIKDLGAETLLPDLSAAATNQQVLVPLDFTMHSLRTIEYAFALMDALPITLNLVHVEGAIAWNDIRNVTREGVSEHRRHRLQDAQQHLKSLIPANLAHRVNLHVRLGPTVEEICSYANSIHASLIIMGVHPKGIIDKLLTGATSYGVLHRARCPVWYVPEKACVHVETAESVQSAALILS